MGVREDKEGGSWLSLRAWRPAQLFTAWSVYWAGLLTFSLREVIAAGFNATQNGGAITGGLSGSRVSVTVTQKAAETLEWSAGSAEMALWVAVPPLLLWAAWLIATRRTADTTASSHPSASLGQGAWREHRSPVPGRVDQPITPLPDERR
jgi:hypothetical protein